jgi:hypothetical protein
MPYRSETSVTTLDSFIVKWANCFGFNYNPSSGTDKNTGRQNAYAQHIIIKGTEISTSPYLQMFLLI